MPIASFSINGQKETILFNVITTDIGLSSSNILNILQDRDGFIWIGTYDGLNKYDGKNFEIFRNEINEANSLPDNLIRSLYLDPEDNLFVGTNSGISKYNKSTGQFINYTKDSSSCLYNMNFQARKITSDKNKILWIATNSGLLRFDIQGNNCQFSSYNPQNQESLSNAFCNDVFIDSKNRIWVSTQKGLNIYDYEKRKFRRIIQDVNGKDYSEFLFMKTQEDQSGNIWASSEKGLFKIDETEKNNEQLIYFAPDPDDPNSISANLLSELYVDKNNVLWIGAENNGMFQFNRNEKKFNRVLSGGSNVTDLDKISINAIFQDNTGNMWFGTYGHGILLASENSHAISLFEEITSGEKSYSDLLVNCFLEDSKGRIWIGTDGNGIFQFNKQTREFTNFSTKNSELTNNYILSMTEDPKGIIWMVTWDGGLIYFNPERELFKAFNRQNSSIPDNKIYTITLGNNNDFWLGSHYTGLINYNQQTNEFTSINELNNNFGNNTINVIVIGEKSNLYIGTTKSLIIYNPKTGLIKRISDTDEALKNIANVEINDIVIENDTSLWLATLLGLYNYNPEKEILTGYTTEDGLPGNVITGLVTDKSGFIWVSTTTGICRMDTHNSKFTCFTREDGMQSNEFRPRSVQIDSEGNLYFGGVNGFNIINPDKIQKNNTIPQIQLTGFDIFHHPVRPGAPGSPLKQIISETSQIKLNYKQTNLTFHFAVLDYTSPGKNQYAYKLQNFDKEWTYSGNNGVASYTNLDPGKYILMLKGANNDKVWNETGTMLNIIITPPWWKTWWFRIISAMFLVMFIFAIFYIRISNLTRKKAQLEAKVMQRTKELAEINTTKDKLFSIIAHDLISPFNVLTGYTELLIQDFHSFSEEELIQILSSLNQTSENAYLLLKNLLDWSRSQRGAIDFTPIYVKPFELVSNTLEEVVSIATKKEISIINNVSLEEERVFVDVNMISLVLRNLLMNAIKFSNPKTEIRIDTEKNVPGFVTFKVIDEGIGIRPEKIKTIFTLGESTSTDGTSGEKGTGLGLILSKDFITKHNGNIWIESEPGKGTTFFFTVPKN